VTVIGAGLQRWESGPLFLKHSGLGNPFLAGTRKAKSQHIDYNIVFCTLKGIITPALVFASNIFCNFGLFIKTHHLSFLLNF
jgi:hypothetical protein